MGHTGSGIEITLKCTPDGTLSSHHSNSYIYLDFHIIILVCKSFICHLRIFCINSVWTIPFASAKTLFISKFNSFIFPRQWFVTAATVASTLILQALFISNITETY